MVGRSKPYHDRDTFIFTGLRTCDFCSVIIADS